MTEEIKVLIVEDEKMWSKTLANILNDFGYTIAGIADNFEGAVTLGANVNAFTQAVGCAAIGHDAALHAALDPLISYIFRQSCAFIGHVTHSPWSRLRRRWPD